MKLYSSLSEDLITLERGPDPLGIYCCGITPYDTTHLGHAFTYCSVDILIRYLEYKGIGTHYIQNVTDIDDDMLREASKRNEDWIRLGNRWTAHFIEDMTALNVRPPDQLPRATAAVAEIVSAVESLVESGHAYIEAGSVYYDLASWPDYGQLSKLPVEEMLPIANQRGNNPDDPNKHHPLDFVLWQAQAEGEPSWNSPWGPGRPGWHIECSTLAGTLGRTLDIHAGGSDLIFPHHESEIAQSEALRDYPLSRAWMHIAMVEHQSEKMSKSLGNLVLIRELLDSWSPNAIRLYLANHPYRVEWSHSEDELELVAEWAETMRRALQRSGESGELLKADWAVDEFESAIETDLNTADAVRIVVQLAREILEAGGDIRSAQSTLETLAGILGLRLQPGPPPRAIVDGWKQHL